MSPQHFIESWRKGLLTKQKTPLSDPIFRELVYQELHPTPKLEDRALLLHFLSLEISYRSDESNDGEHFENLYWCALLLYQLGFLEDVLPMWRAKQLNMDTGCGFDIQFLVGAGVVETLSYLDNSDEPDAQEAYDYLLSCNEADDFGDLATWLQGRIQYYE